MSKREDRLYLEVELHRTFRRLLRCAELAEKADVGDLAAELLELAVKVFRTLEEVSQQKLQVGRLTAKPEQAPEDPLPWP